MGSWLQLKAGESTAKTYVTGPEAATAAVALYHAWWGLDEDVTTYADRLGAAGFLVAAPDLVSGVVATTVEDAEALANGADEDHADRAAFAAIDYLAAELGEGVPVALVGFSFGAWWAVTTAAGRDEVRGSVVYYGAVWGDFVADSTAPVLGHFAEHDEFEPEENVRAFEAAIANAGREVTLHRYPDTGHWFAEPSRSTFVADQADLAFERTVAFLKALEEAHTP